MMANAAMSDSREYALDMAISSSSVTNHIRQIRTAGILILFIWSAAYLCAMSQQNTPLLRICAYTQWLVLAAGSMLLFLGRPRIISEANKKLPFHWPDFLALVIILLALAWGITDIFYWDGIQTAGRSYLFLLGRTEDLPRFSLTYVILAGAFQFLGNANWVGHLIILLWAIGLLLLTSWIFRGRPYRLLAVAIVFFSPYVFVLSKWLYLDMPLMTGAFASILAHEWAVRRPSAGRFLVAMVVLTATCLLKESGVIVVFPLLVLPFLCPRNIRLKVAAWTLINCAIGLASFGFLAWLYRHHSHTEATDVGWLLLNRRYAAASKTILWFLWAIGKHLQALTSWSLLLFALAGLVIPRGRGGRRILAGLIAIQILLMLFICTGFDIKKGFHYWPLDVHVPGKADVWLLGMALGCLVGGFLFGKLGWRRPRRIEILCWLSVISTIFIFSAMGKCYVAGKAGPWITIDWRYLGLAAPFLLVVAVKGASILLGRWHPGWFRALAAVALALSVQVMAMRAVTMAAYYSEKAHLYQSAFDTVVKQPQRTLFTHWPFCIGLSSLDYGSLKWKSEGFDLRDIRALPALRKNPATQLPPNSILLHDNDLLNSLRMGELFPDAISSQTATLRYLRPLDMHRRKQKLNSIYIARVGATKPVPKAPSAPVQK